LSSSDHFLLHSFTLNSLTIWRAQLTIRSTSQHVSCYLLAIYLPFKLNLAHLISITPEEVLGSDVLVGIFSTLLQRRLMFPVPPMGIPQVPRIHTGNDQEWDCDATKVSLSPSHPSFTASCGPCQTSGSLTRLRAFAKDLQHININFHCILSFIYNLPLVAAAWALTACLSRLKALSTAPFNVLVSVLASLRCNAARTVGERNCAAARAIDR
jgi:hypothetical protein